MEDTTCKISRLSEDTIADILTLIHKEVVPALGCTEPIAVAYGVACAVKALGHVPQKIKVELSGNMLKNAMGVGIPGTGMIGLPIAIALGAVAGDADAGLEVLRNVDGDAVKRARQYVEEGHIDIRHASDSPCLLYIVIEAVYDADTVRVIIADSHTNIISLERNGVSLIGSNGSLSETAHESAPTLDFDTVYRFATTTPVERLQFINEAAKLNMAAARTALDSEYGHSLGATIRGAGEKYFGHTPVAHIISYTSAACDARMGGAQVAVMSNSGSGNQGITATVPVVCLAEDLGSDSETLTRALILSHLTSIYIKQSLGRLSALCGCVVASTGAAAGMTYLMGGDFSATCYAIKNMVANLTGMICDGAKPSCSMKIASASSTALMSAMLAVNNRYVTSAEGIIADDIDATLHNLTSIGRESMRETDRHILNIMVNK